MITLGSLVLFSLTLWLLVVAAKQRRPALFIFSLILMFGHSLPLLSVIGLGEIGYQDLTFGDFETLPQVLAAVLLTIISFTAIYLITFNRKLRALQKRDSAEAVLTLDLSFRSLGIMNWALAASILLLVAFDPRGLLGFLADSFARVPVPSTISSIVYALSVLYTFTTIFQLLRNFAQKRKVALYHVVISSLMFFLLGGRIQFAITVVSYLCALVYSRQIRLRSIIMFGGLGLIPVNMIILLRLAQQGHTLSLAEAFTLTLNQMSMLNSYDLAVRYVNEFGYHPSLYFNSLIQIVPRSLYPAKPEQLSRTFRWVFFGDDLGGIPPGLIGEFFLSGGFIGCLIGGALFGAILKVLDQTINTLHFRRRSNQALVISLIPIFSFYLVRVGFDTAIFRILLVFLVYLPFAAIEGRIMRLALIRKHRTRVRQMDAARVLSGREPIA